MKRALFVVILMITAAVAASAQSAAPVTLPKQHIVFVIDNSGSMATSDPLGLRGVAASLVLDAAEISSDVEAGLVLFSDHSQTDGKLHSSDEIRQSLGPTRLPPAGGGTNLYDALARAIAIFSNSTAAIKRIVLITDGMPDGNQAAEIVAKLVPAAQAAGIQVFALGMSTQINKDFIDAVTSPTGGLTLISEHHHQLLRHAKRLIGDRDNVFTLAEQPLAASQNEYSFTIGAGVDRARITAILDQPREFASGELTLTLAGPSSAGEQPYLVRTDNGDRIAAWTAFFSTPGNYTLRVETAKPGGHKGMRLFVEALSSLRLQVSLTPPSPRYEFGSEVKVQVSATSASGSVQPPDVTFTGTVEMTGSGAAVIAFNGEEGTFRVRDVGGRHTVIVKGATSLARAEARIEYEAVPIAAPELKSTPAKLDFIRPLGPVDPRIETTFKLVPEFPAGARPRPVRVGFMLVAPAGEVELVAKGGGAIRLNVPSLFTLPSAGAELTLRIKLDPRRPLPAKGGKHSATLRVYSNEAPPLDIPCEYQVNIPQFEVLRPLKAFALWWDPLKPRIVPLGRLHTDLAAPSTFTLVIPDELRDPNRGTKIADVALRIAGKTPGSEPAEAGKLRYGPIDLEPGKDGVLDLVVTPSAATGWQSLPAGRKAFDVDLTSSLGMHTRISTALQTLGPPIGGRIDRHARTIVRFLVIALFFALLALLTVQRSRVVRRFWNFRPGQAVTLGFGDVQIGDASADGAAALILPNSGSSIDDTTVGSVSRVGNSQHVESPTGHLVFARPNLRTGDTLVVSDDPAENTELWQLEYTSVPGEGGEIEVRKNPARWTVGRVFRSLVLSLLFLWGLSVFLGAGVAAALAYRFKFIEAFYLWLFQ